MLITFSFDVVVLRSDKFRTLSLSISIRTHSVYSGAVTQIELTRILFRTSLSSEANAVTFCLSFRSRLRVLLRESFPNPNPGFSGIVCQIFSRQPTRNLRRRFRSGARSEPLNPEGRNRQIDTLFKDPSLSFDPLRSQSFLSNSSASSHQVPCTPPCSSPPTSLLRRGTSSSPDTPP